MKERKTHPISGCETVLIATYERSERVCWLEEHFCKLLSGSCISPGFYNSVDVDVGRREKCVLALNTCSEKKLLGFVTAA